MFSVGIMAIVWIRRLKKSGTAFRAKSASPMKMSDWEQTSGEMIFPSVWCSPTCVSANEADLSWQYPSLHN
jgi:hypothetical protein